MNDTCQQTVAWNKDGLAPAIAQDWKTGEVLMLAWMNEESLKQTLQAGVAVYWSRSREQLWRKGETSGHTQVIKSVRLDCDSDAILLTVEQKGDIACHTGRRSCFYREWREDRWQIVDPILKSPESIYGSGS